VRLRRWGWGWVVIGWGLMGLLPTAPAATGWAQQEAGGEVVIPERTAYVTDVAGVLGPDVEEGLNRGLARVEEEYDTRIYVLTVRLTEPLPIKEYALRVWESWGLDKEDPRERTLIFLVAVEDGQVILSTGRGLEEVLPDERLAEILQGTIVPAFDRGAFGQGIVMGVQEMIRVLAEKEEERASGARPFQPRRLSTVDLLGILLAVVVVTALFWWVNSLA